MTFEEWFVEYNKRHGLPPAHVVAQDAWDAAFEAIISEMIQYVDDPDLVRHLDTFKTALNGPTSDEQGGGSTNGA